MELSRPCGCVEMWWEAVAGAYGYGLLLCDEHWRARVDQLTCQFGQDMYSGGRQQPEREESP